MSHLTYLRENLNEHSASQAKEYPNPPFFLKNNPCHTIMDVNLSVWPLVIFINPSMKMVT